MAVVTDTADARGPAYSGPTTQSTGEAYFGPAPNPFPYCDSPTYFDPFPENVDPIGRMDVGDTASVTTDGITMGLTITSEGNEDTQYPGFFPFDDGVNDDGSSGDQPKGIELAEGDGAVVTLNEPLFYSQWIFTDVDQPNEGFTVTPAWTTPGQAAAFGGDNQFTFAGSNTTAVELDDIDGDGHASESINGRVQVDFLGAVTGISMLRTFPSNGQSGFAVGGGCEAAGAAKALVAGPTWNGTSFDVTYELRMRNNLPSSSTIQAVINDAVQAVGASFVTGTPAGIDLTDLQLTDDLRDPAFSNIEVTDLSTAGSLTLNNNFDGVTDFELIQSGSIAAESDELITLSVQYTPDLTTTAWDNCEAGFNYLNQTTVSGAAANVPVSDVSDDGVNAAPSNNNGFGGVDDPTPVNFDCPPGDLEIVKTVVAGPNGACPTFDLGVPGPGDALPVTVDDTVSYCIAVRNPGPGPVNDVLVDDPQAPGQFSLGDLQAGETAFASYDVVVAISTPPENTATATGTDSAGAVGPVSDNALIQPEAKPLPILEIVKTVYAGPNADCGTFDDGIAGIGPALGVLDGDTVTYCVSVRNTGPGDALNVNITDPQAPQAFAIGTLLTGQEATVSYDLQVDLNTEEENVATGAYSGPDGPLAPVNDNAQIDVSPLEPALEIVKTAYAGPTADCGTFDDGVPGLGAAVVVDDRDSVTYCVSVRNIGRGIATDVVVNDTQAPGPLAIGSLNAGEERTVTYDIVARLTTEPINTATATGNGPTGPLDEVSDQAQISVDALPDPGLQIIKTAVAGPNGTCPAFDQGTPGLGTPVPFVETDTVTYCISVRNVGPGPATDVVIGDDQAPNTFDLNIGDLAVDQVVDRQYDIADLTVQSPTVNTATADGNGLNGPLDQVSDPAEIVVSLQPDPILEIVKTVVADGVACPATFAEGIPGDGSPLPVLYTESVTFCITVRNVGDNDATNVMVVDNQAPGTLQLGTIPVGQEASASYPVVVDASTPAQNTATATGQGPNGQLPAVSDTALIAPSLQPDPVLDIVKTVVGPGETCPADFAGGTPGDGDPLDVLYTEVVTYCVTVRNIGENPATDVVITDPQAPAPGTIAVGTIDEGQEVNVSYTVIVDADTPTTNTASASGQGPNGSVGPVSDTAVINPLPQPDPVLEIVKTVVPGPNGNCPTTFLDGTPGDGDPLSVAYGTTVTYCVSVRNVAGNPATNVIVSDPQAPGDIDLGTIAVGGEASTSYDVEVNANTPLTNTASASGQGPNGSVGPVTDTAVITPAAAVLDIVKTAVKGPLGVCPAFDDGVVGEGDALQVMYTEVVTYCLTVKNVGANPASGVMIADPQAPETYDIGTLAPGEEVTRSYDKTIDADTPTRNVATATGTGPGGEEIPSVEDPAIIDPSPLPDPVLEIVKTVVEGPNGDCPATFDLGVPGDGDALKVEPGETVTYCITIRNSGTGDATNVSITDDQAPQSYDFATFAAGAEASVAYDLPVTPEIALKNTAFVTGTGPNSEPGELQASDTAVIDTRTVNISLIHSVSKTDECITEAKPLNSLAADIEDLPIIWCAKITNNGSEFLTNVRLTAPNIGIEDLDIFEGTDQTVLAPGDENAVFLSFAGVIPNEGLISQAGVKADPSDAQGNVITDLPSPADADNATVLEASIDIESTVIPGPEGSCDDAGELATVSAGDLVTWCYTVTNTGFTVLGITEVVDEVLGLNLPVPEEFERFAVGATFVVSADVIAEGPTTNDGDIKGQPLGFAGEVLEAPPVEDRDDASIETAAADLAIVKSNANNGPVPAGARLTYTLVVTNNGPGAAEDVKVTDTLPAGPSYATVPSLDGWVCALDSGERSFTCLKSEPMAADASATLIYQVNTPASTQFVGVTLINTATVTSSTPDPDPTNNTDTSPTFVNVPTSPPPLPPVSPPPLPPPAPPLAPPDEVLGLAITGAMSNLLGLLAAAMMSVGGLFTVGARRSRDEE